MLQFLSFAALYLRYLSSFNFLIRYGGLYGILSVPNEKKCRCGNQLGSQNKVTQTGTGTLRYQTEMMGAGIQMPAASALMPMPSYDSSSPSLFLLSISNRPSPLYNWFETAEQL
jgi:hypothetical protein